MSYRLLDEFERLFKGQPYLHRNSSLGDFVAMHLFEDLVVLGKSNRLTSRVQSQEVVLTSQNKRRGISARRGDGTLGEIVPGEAPLVDPGFLVSRGQVATVEVGVEVKILAKAMIKQIDRVIASLNAQVDHFKKGSGQPITVAIIGVNHAPIATGYEGAREFRTDGKSNRHPIQEAAEAIRRLTQDAKPKFDEFVFLRYSASNEPPFRFEWVDFQNTQADYAAALTRISREYERRF